LFKNKKNQKVKRLKVEGKIKIKKQNNKNNLKNKKQLKFHNQASL